MHCLCTAAWCTKKVERASAAAVGEYSGRIKGKVLFATFFSTVSDAWTAARYGAEEGVRTQVNQNPLPDQKPVVA